MQCVNLRLNMKPRGESRGGPTTWPTIGDDRDDVVCRGSGSATPLIGIHLSPFNYLAKPHERLHIRRREPLCIEPPCTIELVSSIDQQETFRGEHLCGTNPHTQTHTEVTNLCAQKSATTPQVPRGHIHVLVGRGRELGPKQRSGTSGVYVHRKE